MTKSDSKLKQTLQKIIDYAGIKFDGANPWDIKIHNDDFYRRVWAHASLGLGESYMDGSCPQRLHPSHSQEAMELESPGWPVIRSL